MQKPKNASDIQKMSKMATNATTTSYFDNLTNLAGSLTTSKEKVAVAEMSHKCEKMCMSPKVMGGNLAAVSTHSFSEASQINMAGNI
jgi:hypothetical protein